LPARGAAPDFGAGQSGWTQALTERGGAQAVDLMQTTGSAFGVRAELRSHDRQPQDSSPQKVVPVWARETATRETDVRGPALPPARSSACVHRIDRAEVQALLRAAGKRATLGPTEYALVPLLIESGLRVGEVVPVCAWRIRLHDSSEGARTRGQRSESAGDPPQFNAGAPLRL